jgi:hypothetical protein
MPTRLLLIVLGLLLFSPAARSEESAPLQRELTTRVFDGQSLQGWHVTGCDVGVEEGKLVIRDGDGFVRTDHRYRDFVLELSYKPRRSEKYDSGIYIRAELPPSGKPWPAKHQINLKQGDEANLIGFKEARSSGLIQPGEWNRLKVTVVGDTVAMEINGQAAWKTSGLEPREGYVGIQVEVPGGGQFEFKDITITEIGYDSLFNGVDLTGWEGAGQDAAACWKVEEGLLLCTGAKGPWLRSKEEYGDFNFRFAYKLKEGGNSGVYIRVPASGNHHGAQAGIEVQLLDDHAKRYEKLKPYQYSGSLYAIVPAEPRVCRPVGEWNSMEIDCRGMHYLVIHNGVEVIRASAADYPALAERLTRGFLGLQNHSEEVWFRDLRIGPSVQAASENDGAAPRPE